MSEKQRVVLGVAVVSFILAAMFVVPWRMESSGEIKWAPVYRKPYSYVRSYRTDLPSTRYQSEDGKIAIGLFAGELIAIGLIGWVAFATSADPNE